MKQVPAHKPTKESFAGEFERLLPSKRLEEACRYKATNRGRRPKVLIPELIMVLVFRVMNGAGKLGESFAALTGEQVAESTLSERRSSLPWEVFERIMDWALKPLAKKEAHPEAFYKGWRLVAVDGTRFSLTNTPQVLEKCTKAASRRMKAAFAKMDLVVLLELALHNPIAAAVAEKSNGSKGSEWELALRVLKKVPSDALLLADRLYGCGRFLWELTQQSTQSAFLIRINRQNKPKLLDRLSDGSRLIEVILRDQNQRSLGRVQLREIYVRVKRKGRSAVTLRLWTNLMDPTSYPAEELAALYSRRWDHEVYYREMKLEMRPGELLDSHTPHTAAQEIAALVLATGFIAHHRMDAADAAQLPVLRISFIKTLRILEPLWLIFELGDDILSEEQKKQLLEKFYNQLASMATAKRRSRSCPRKVRQPIGGWPRKLVNQSFEGEVSYKILQK